jgi:hypothetical protein
VCVRACVCVFFLMNKMGCVEFMSLYVDIDVMRIYVVGADVEYIH